MNGYTGRILSIDLSSSSYSIEEIPDSIYKKYLSGLGLGVYYLSKHLPVGCDPLGPDNILGFVSGLLTGTGSLMTGRWLAVCKSPLTGGWGDANCGGTFSPAIKRSGYDAIFFRGKANNPTCVLIENEKVSFLDASKLWGMDAVKTEEYLIDHYKTIGKKISAAVIGEAGEKLSLISGICNSGGRIAARSGVGAIMGSKNLKALVLHGTHPIKGHDPYRIKSMNKQFTKKLKAQRLQDFVPAASLPVVGGFLMGGKLTKRIPGILYSALLKKWGTIVSNTLGMPAGDNPIMNWKGTVKDYTFRDYQKMNPDLVSKHEVRKYSCYSCAISCGGICTFTDPETGEEKESHKPEYETTNAFGALLMNSDLEVIFQINDLLNRAGMDTISAGGTIAFAMECFEQGILTREDTDGLDLSWGNANVILELLKMMIHREGLGDILADGVKKAAERIGKDSEKYAIHAGGQEPGMHDSRLDPQLGLQYSVDPTPGRHTIGTGLYYNMMQLWECSDQAPKSPLLYPRNNEFKANEENGQISYLSSCVKMVLDGAGGCLFALISGLPDWPLFEYLNAATGWDLSPDEYLLIGKRIQTLRQLFNIRECIDPKTTKMHGRALGHPSQKVGPLRGKQVPINEMRIQHWQAFGWNPKTGHPTEETIKELGLSDL